METVLKVDNVSKTFGTGEAMNRVLDHVSIEIQRGEFASLMGASGSGKSTLLYLCGGLDTDYEGDIYICGQKMTGMKESEMSALRLSKIGFIFQFYNLIQNLTVEDNILLPIKKAGKNVPNYQEYYPSRKYCLQMNLPETWTANPQRKSWNFLSESTRRKELPFCRLRIPLKRQSTVTELFD